MPLCIFFVKLNGCGGSLEDASPYWIYMFTVVELSLWGRFLKLEYAYIGNIWGVEILTGARESI